MEHKCNKCKYFRWIVWNEDCNEPDLIDEDWVCVKKKVTCFWEETCNEDCFVQQTEDNFDDDDVEDMIREII